ncbi:hypothetical protein I7I51_07514 [Histoplasma capsulatum]|uniref:Uncharacterized protein n=1 Tax=Ajellomyces capsulatus TaxID=5037 RepID=A0A8A1M0Y4_AJECA|nr:hypothetical protein I7I51_07514 [Histoplasma capsulatum]
MLAAHFGPQISESPLSKSSARKLSTHALLHPLPSPHNWRIARKHLQNGDRWRYTWYSTGKWRVDLILLTSTLVNKLGPNDIISAFPPTDYFAPNPATMASLSSRL